MFANCQGGGYDLCAVDICKTPPAGVPLPYPNFAMGCQAILFNPRVIVQTGPAHHLGTMIPTSSGDEPGAMGGVVSLIIKGPSRHSAGSAKVIWGGLPASRTTSPTLQNVINGLGCRVAPSQTKVLLCS
ncbi:MAG TPA: DUF4150 domain-containing protein [Polyangiaceae bacterium]|nr:DUF4150 domain-containing protein [Polyangiaceae bacterium]